MLPSTPAQERPSTHKKAAPSMVSESGALAPRPGTPHPERLVRVLVGTRLAPTILERPESTPSQMAAVFFDGSWHDWYPLIWSFEG
jgi:hypothetical protein